MEYHVPYTMILCLVAHEYTNGARSALKPASAMRFMRAHRNEVLNCVSEFE